MLRRLIGSGDKIMLLVLPFVVIGVILNVAYPSLFDVGGPPDALRVISIIGLVPGAAIWIWSVVLILINVPRGMLITSGPYALVKHPIYTAVALLVLPWAGFLVNTWLGAALGIVLYAASRLFAGEEEVALARQFGPGWDAYRRRVWMPWA
jgi:protein-S-isoprenylcysteine O-methyltransferase Ste14